MATRRHSAVSETALHADRIGVAVGQASWNYRTDDVSARLIGPMAQDLTSAFGVGSDDRSIHPMDWQEEALAAIQGLAAQIATPQHEQHRLMELRATLDARGGTCPESTGSPSRTQVNPIPISKAAVETLIE